VSALTIEANCVHRTGHLSDREIAAATGAKASTVRDRLRGRSSPTGSRAARLIELGEVTDRLARLMDADYILALDDDKPVERLARGDYRSIATLVASQVPPGRGSAGCRCRSRRTCAARSRDRVRAPLRSARR
jgi:hypothetical protein